MAARITNKQLNQLLVDLGFERGEATTRHKRFWHHAEAGTTVVLPDNKALEAAAQIDVMALREHLHFRGHMTRDEFDGFLADGQLPART